MDIFQHIVNGLIAGSNYGLLALGMTMVYGILTIPDFSMGAIFALGSFISFYVVTFLGPEYYILSLIPIILIAGFIGVLNERFVFRPLHKGPHAAGFIGALGLYSIMEGAWNILFGTNWRAIDLPMSSVVITIGAVSLTVQRLFIFCGSLIFAFATYFFVYRTMAGRMVRACSENINVAKLLGVNTSFMNSLTFFVAYSLIALGGMLIAPTTMVGASMGMTPIIKAFIIVALGGLGSVPGAIVGGLIMGVAENLGVAYLSSMYKDLYPFAIFLLVLLWRPQGLFQR